MTGTILNPQSLNYYGYGDNNPVGNVDPSGMCAEDADQGLSNVWNWIEQGYSNLQQWSENTQLAQATEIEEMQLAREGVQPTDPGYDAMLAQGVNNFLQTSAQAQTFAMGIAGGDVGGPEIDINIKPTVANQKLQNIVNDIYKGQNSENIVGNGTTMDAIRNELQTGQPTNGKFHTIKGQELVNGLTNLLNKGYMSVKDSSVANALLQDLKNALQGL